MAKKRKTSPPCPCGSGREYAACCGPFIVGAEFPPTAEALMRSRYSAFVHGAADYLLRTWHPETRPRRLELVSGQPKWSGLEVLGWREDAEAGTAEVEFIARFKQVGRAGRLHEVSRFRRLAGAWLYVDGRQR